jgi:hypothetical protein
VSRPLKAGEGPCAITLVLVDRADSFFALGVLPSLATSFQLDAAPNSYEVLVIARPERERELGLSLTSLGVPGRVIPSDSPEAFVALGASEARGESLCFVGDPGAASPLLVASLAAALSTYPRAVVVIRTLPLGGGALEKVLGHLARGLGVRGWHDDPFALVRQANPDADWLDPIAAPSNLAVPRSLLERRPLPILPVELLTGFDGTRVQLAGDAFLRPRHEGEPIPDVPTASAEERPVDADLHHFGVRIREGTTSVPRPPAFEAHVRPRLSVILVVHDMPREAPRTVRSLLPEYQRGMATDEYEILIIENGSKKPIPEAEVRRFPRNVHYHYLEDPPPSPAHAINFGAARATGEVLAIMIDGACLASPGALEAGLRPFRSFPNPVVVTRYFVLGWGLQRQTMLEGYDATREDELLSSIEWPKDGYRLFEVSSPLTFGGPTEHWLTSWFESNCLFLYKKTFERIGGADERFDFPGGGLVNIDFFVNASELPGAQPICVIGEGVFHQIHGGITSNTPAEDARAKELLYKAQYETLRGRPVSAPLKGYFFMGRLPNRASRKKMRG